MGPYITATDLSLTKHLGKLQTVSDLLLKKPTDLAKKCRTQLKDMEVIINLVCKELDRLPALLRDVAHLGEERFTSGESALDDTLGGGIHTGMLLEIFGEKSVAVAHASGPSH